MLKLVNYIIQNGKLQVKKYQEDGKDFVLYDKKAIAILDTNLDLNQDLTLVKIDDEMFPIIITKDIAKQLAEKQNSSETKIEKANEEGESNG